MEAGGPSYTHILGVGLKNRDKIRRHGVCSIHQSQEHFIRILLTLAFSCRGGDCLIQSINEEGDKSPKSHVDSLG